MVAPVSFSRWLDLALDIGIEIRAATAAKPIPRRTNSNDVVTFWATQRPLPDDTYEEQYYAD